MRKIRVDLTESELRDVINCIDAAERMHLAYGMTPANIENLLMANRRRLLAKLSGIYDKGIR